MICRRVAMASLALMGLIPSAVSGTVPNPCALLAAAGFTDRILSPGEAAYEERVTSWWSQNARLTPTCFVQPRDTPDVAEVLRVLSSDCNAGFFAVRSGGHIQWAGGSNVEDGVVIDLKYLNGPATYDPSKGVASIYPASRWGDVYSELESYGVVVAGGRDAQVGVGGFLTGGGVSFYSARFGFGCDTIVNAEVVLANGTIVEANEDTNPDLLRAIKGGWANFGIVTRFEMIAFPLKPLWGGLRLSELSQGDIIADALVNFTEHQSDHRDANLGITWFYDTSLSPEPVIAQSLVSTETIDSGSAFSQVLQATQISDDFTVRSLPEFAGSYLMPGGLYNFYYSLTVANDARVITKAAELFEGFIPDLLEEIPANDFIVRNNWQGLPRLFADHGVERGGNVLGLDQMEGDSLLWFIGGSTVTAEQEAIFSEKAVAFADELAAYARQINALREWRYINYVDRIQDPISTYGEDNIEFMWNVSARYDPTGFFQERMASGFKLPAL